MSDDAETLAHLDLLQRRRTRISYQLSAAREQVADLERALQIATDDLNLATANYQRASARPLQHDMIGSASAPDEQGAADQANVPGGCA